MDKPAVISKQMAGDKVPAIKALENMYEQIPSDQWPRIDEMVRHEMDTSRLEAALHRQQQPREVHSRLLAAQRELGKALAAERMMRARLAVLNRMPNFLFDNPLLHVFDMDAREFGRVLELPEMEVRTKHLQTVVANLQRQARIVEQLQAEIERRNARRKELRNAEHQLLKPGGIVARRLAKKYPRAGGPCKSTVWWGVRDHLCRKLTSRR